MEPGLPSFQMIKPQLSENMAITLAKDLYGFKVTDIRSMISYDDLNFHLIVEEIHNNTNIETICTHGYTMKVVNNLESSQEGLLEAFQSALLYLKTQGVEVPIPVPNLQGKLNQRIVLPSEDTEKVNSEAVNNDGSSTLFAVHVLNFLPGKPLSSVQYKPEVLHDVGRTVGQVITAFQGFTHPVLEQRSSLWSLWSIPKLKEYVTAVKDNSRRQIVEDVISNFENQVLPIVKNFTQGLIHGDLNEHNLLVTSEPGRSGFHTVSGVLDLGDVSLGPRVFEIAVSSLYPMLGGEERLGTLDPLLAPGYVLRGLQEIIQLSDEEKRLLKPCIEARLAQSLTMGAYTNLLQPGNEYVLDSARHGWTILERLHESDSDELTSRWEAIAQNG